MIKTALMCLSMAIYHESRGEPIKGQYAVAEVVLNRADKRNLDVCEVIYEKDNFKMQTNGKCQVNIIKIGR